MSASDCTQPAVKPPHRVLELSGPIGDDDNHPITQENVTSTCLLDDVDAKGVTSSPSHPLSDNSPNPSGVTIPLDDANASYIERGTSGPADNVDASSAERGVSRLSLDASADMYTSSAHQGIPTAAPTGLKLVTAQAKRQLIKDAVMQLQYVTDQIEEILDNFPSPVEPSSTSGASGPSLNPADNLLQGTTEPIHAGTPLIRRLILRALESLALRCLVMAVDLWRCDLQAIEGNE
ncbi:hypothetical protein LXA43DRAFT_1099438 [Ganoderma leucocontextum]|nr:hypothetical protein LXA43DRAFT_1099438 [Ganoderma leucocontextum]